jgi:hypothetical protein
LREATVPPAGKEEVASPVGDVKTKGSITGTD